MALRRVRSQFSNENFQYVLEVEFRLDSFKKYIEITEQVIEKEVVQEIRKYEELIKNSRGADLEMLYSFEDPIIVRRHVSELYFSSIYISMYSFLEQKMLQLCKLNEHNYDLKVNDLNGDGIFKFYKYLKKVIKINLDNVNTEWEQLQKANKLRNLLVHSPQNCVDNKPQNEKLINALKSIQHLYFREEGNTFFYSINDKSVLLNFSKTIGEFFNKIYYERVIRSNRR